MSAEFAPALVALTTLMKDTLASDDPRRFFIVHCLSRTAQQLLRTLAIRVEDFDDPDRIRAKTNFIKGFSSPERQVPVPPDLVPDSRAVLEALTRVMVITLDNEHLARFAEVERLTDTAQAFLAAVVPPPPRPKVKTGDDEEDAIVCEDPEGGYVNRAIARAYNLGNIMAPAGVPRRLALGGDVNELRREVIAAQGTKGQMEAELLQAQIASAEAAEYEHLSKVSKEGHYTDMLAVKPRLRQLRARLELRTEGKSDAVVSTNISRGHQPGGEGAGDNDTQGDEGHAEREAGPREAPQEGAREAVGMFTMGEA